MIFVTVGTTHPFDRLVKAVDEAVDRGTIQEPVFAQTGHGDYRARHFKCVPYLTKDDFEARVRGAAAVISHAGVGVITCALDHGKPVLVLARRRRYGEVVNDHQVAMAEELARLGHVLVASDETELMSRVGDLREFVPQPRRAAPQLVVARVKTFLAGV